MTIGTQVIETCCHREPHRHGTVNGYRVCKCRCPKCTEAHRLAMAQYKRQKVEAQWGNPDPGRRPGYPVTRRLQALAAIGWDQKSMADELGIHRSALHRLLHGRTPSVLIETDLLVRRLYRDAKPRSGTYAANQARAVARKNGWGSPLSWDDIDRREERPKGRTP